jgi:putative tryptophan/tyrosine transport system substrate-binding protein
MRRRELLTAIIGTCAAPGAFAQPSRPVIGYLRTTPAGPFAHLVESFRVGLAERGLVEGESVAIEYRFADNRLDRLPALAADLIQREVAVIVGNQAAVEAARALTRTIPIVFVVGEDPVKVGLVPSLSAPGGQLTGVTFFGGGQLNVKRLEFLAELVPGASPIGILLDPTYPGAATVLTAVTEAARSLRREAPIAEAASEGEIDPALATLKQAGARALLVIGSPLFTSHRRRLIAAAARHGLPAIYDIREFVAAGGLISFGASLREAYRLAGVYAGRIVRGERPSDLPVVQPTSFELAIHAGTARALGLTIPPALLARADEVIE